MEVLLNILNTIISTSDFPNPIAAFEILQPLTEIQFEFIKNFAIYKGFENAEAVTYTDYLLYMTQIMELLSKMTNVEFAEYVKSHDYLGFYYPEFTRSLRIPGFTLKPHTFFLLFSYHDFIEYLCKERNVMYNIGSFSYQLMYEHIMTVSEMQAQLKLHPKFVMPPVFEYVSPYAQLYDQFETFAKINNVNLHNVNTLTSDMVANVNDVNANLAIRMKFLDLLETNSYKNLGDDLTDKLLTEFENYSDLVSNGKLEE